MPVGIDKAPDVLPQAAKKLWVDTFNGVFDNCKGSTKECDERAARIAWDGVKGQYKKVKTKWVRKKTTKSETDAYIDAELVITKATLQADGTMRWQAVTSDTEADKSREKTSLALFRDWIERIDYGLATDFLPDVPKMPFLGLSHYPAFDDGFGEAGPTTKMYTDGSQFKACGTFYNDDDHPLGAALFEAVRAERALIKKGEVIDNPIRISAGWWDIQHSHGEFVFTRRSLTDICPMCSKGVGDKTYLKGQLDHFAATRVPMNPRTSLSIEEKSMATTRKEDAASIVPEELAEELDEKARVIGKSETEADENELPTGMVVRAEEDDEENGDKKEKKPDSFGEFLKSRRKKKNMSLDVLSEVTGIEKQDLSAFETNKRSPGKRMIDLLAEALGLETEEMAAMMPKDKDRKRPDSERGPGEGVQIAVPVEAAQRPFGGATSIDDAEGFMDTQETLSEMHSNWDVFRMVVSNILASDMEQVPDKVAAMAAAINQFGQRIDALKASLADAFLLQSAAVVDETPAEVNNQPDVLRSNDIMSDKTQQPETAQAQHPADIMKAAIDQAMANNSLNTEAKEEAVQKALNDYTAVINQQLEREDPTRQTQAIAEAMKSAMADVMAPLQESLGLLNAKLGEQATQPQAVHVALPQQKSYAAQPTQPAPVGGNGQLPISSVTGKPSSIRAAINKSVGILTS